MGASFQTGSETNFASVVPPPSTRSVPHIVPLHPQVGQDGGGNPRGGEKREAGGRRGPQPPLPADLQRRLRRSQESHEQVLREYPASMATALMMICCVLESEFVQLSAWKLARFKLKRSEGEAMASINTCVMSGRRHAADGGLKLCVGGLLLLVKLTGTRKNYYSPASQRCDRRLAHSWTEYIAAKNTKKTSPFRLLALKRCLSRKISSAPFTAVRTRQKSSKAILSLSPRKPRK